MGGREKSENDEEEVLNETEDNGDEAEVEAETEGDEDEVIAEEADEDAVIDPSNTASFE
jgi:hypothetical protein